MKINNTPNIFETNYIYNSTVSKGIAYPYSAPEKQSDSFEYTTKTPEMSDLKTEFQTIKNNQALIGKVWDGFKNTFGFKSGSKYVEQVLKKAENGEITNEEAKEIIQKYKDGQKMCVDVAADIVSGIVALGAFALAVPTGGASLAIGLGVAAAVGAGTKITIKATDAKLTKNDYSSKDLLYDTLTGGINGVLAPVTNGIGNSVAKTIGQKLGLTVFENGVKQAAKTSAQQGIKGLILTKTVDVAGGTLFKRSLALGTGMAVDGAISGAGDNMVRAALNGENIIKAGLQGAAGGAILSPIIGGGFRVISKAGNALNTEITARIILPDGLNTKFKQGLTGDCAVLSTVDAMMNNPQSAKNIRKAVTKTLGGDYNVKIGDNIVRVAKNSLTDEMLSDTTGIRIFEAAYKQLTGNIDGGFAEIVAKQFGLNPVHITNDAITDELLDRLAKEGQNGIFSLGTLIDSNGDIAQKGSRHYFTIKNIDSQAKTVTLTSPLDSSKALQFSYDDIKALGISIDGGTIKETNLPNFARRADDISFRGLDVSRTKSKLLSEMGLSENQAAKILSDIEETVKTDDIAAMLELHNVSVSDFVRELNLQKQNFDGDIEFALLQTIDNLKKYPIIAEDNLFTPFKLSFKEASELSDAIASADVNKIYSVLGENNPEVAKMFRQDGIIENYLHTIYNKMALDNYVGINPEDIIDLGLMNGKSKKIIFPNVTEIPPAKTIDMDAQTLIKSNLITMELIDATQDVPLPKVKKMKAITSQKLELNPEAIRQKAMTYGIDSLSTYEIHALTDCFSDIPEITEAANRILRNTSNPTNKQLRQLCGYAEHLKKLAKPVLEGSKVEIDDHAFLRMLDRNMVSVADNQHGCLLDYKELIEVLKTAVEQEMKSSSPKKEIILKGYRNGSGIKLLLKYKPDGTCVIDSIM